MLVMDESEFIARALRDYLRSRVDQKVIRTMDWDLDAGEPVSAVCEGLAIADQYSLSLPPLFVQKIEAIEDLRDIEREFIVERLANLPTWWELAS